MRLFAVKSLLVLIRICQSHFKRNIYWVKAGLIIRTSFSNMIIRLISQSSLYCIEYVLKLQCFDHKNILQRHCIVRYKVMPAL